MLKMYLNTKYFLHMYLNTKYFFQMYLNTKYIDVFKYFRKYFFKIIFKISTLFIQSIKNLKMNEILGIKLVQLYSSYVNDITDMHVIYHIACW